MSSDQLCNVFWPWNDVFLKKKKKWKNEYAWLVWLQNQNILRQHKTRKKNMMICSDSLTYQQWMHGNTCHRLQPTVPPRKANMAAVQWQWWSTCWNLQAGLWVKVTAQRRDKASALQTDTSCVSYSSRNEFNLCLPMELLTLNNLQGVFACQGSSEIMRLIIPPEF